MKIAVYSRKSKFTGKGDSVENQIQLCKEYIGNHYAVDSDDDILIYEDEGFSGGTADRPQYQQLLLDATAKKFKLLLCYRLDRISRNISDFSSLVDSLQIYDIGFVSIREQFDTTTPMGRAMMYIASVFAQLERETIAERIRDNMHQLAKTGRWLGGNTPTGFASKGMIKTDIDGKERKSYKLEEIKGEIDTVKLIFEKFVEMGSLTKLEAYLMQNDFKSKNGNYFSRFTLKTILSNPVYATADKRIYDYLIANNCDVYADAEEFTGKYGIIAYNKTLQKKHTASKIKDITEWIIAIGKHKGVVPGNLWIGAQTILFQNKSKSYRKVKNSESLLSGILRCSECGSFMRPRAAGRLYSDGKQRFYYMCELKERSRRHLCNIKNADGNELDRLVIDEIKKLSSSDFGLGKKISAELNEVNQRQRTIKVEIANMQEAIKANSIAIQNLVESLSQSKDTPAAKYMIAKINELDKKNNELKRNLLALQESESANQGATGSINMIDSLVSTFSSTVDTMDVMDKRNLLHSIISRITWDGKDADIEIFSKKMIPQRECSK